VRGSLKTHARCAVVRVRVRGAGAPAQRGLRPACAMLLQPRRAAREAAARGGGRPRAKYEKQRRAPAEAHTRRTRGARTSSLTLSNAPAPPRPMAAARRRRAEALGTAEVRQCARQSCVDENEQQPAKQARSLDAWRVRAHTHASRGAPVRAGGRLSVQARASARLGRTQTGAGGASARAAHAQRRVTPRPRPAASASLTTHAPHAANDATRGSATSEWRPGTGRIREGSPQIDKFCPASDARAALPPLLRRVGRAAAPLRRAPWRGVARRPAPGRPPSATLRGQGARARPAVRPAGAAAGCRRG
jgi:hypothetical protein